MVEGSTEARLARLETLPDSLARIEAVLSRVSDRLDAFHRLEQQQEHHTASIERAFEAVEKLAGQCEKSFAEVGKRVSDLERMASEKLGWARGWVSMASAVLGLAQLAVMGMAGYLFSHIASVEASIAELSKASAVIEQRLTAHERLSESRIGR